MLPENFVTLAGLQRLLESGVPDWTDATVGLWVATSVDPDITIRMDQIVEATFSGYERQAYAPFNGAGPVGETAEALVGWMHFEADSSISSPETVLGYFVIFQDSDLAPSYFGPLPKGPFTFSTPGDYFEIMVGTILQNVSV